MRQVPEVTKMVTETEEVSYSNSFCGYCRFFGQCDTDYGDFACWEYVDDGVCSGNGVTGESE